MLGFHPKFLIPNAFTAFSMMFGLASAAASAQGEFTLAAWMILWGVLLDKLDGTAARLLKASSDFGVQYDSFADFVAFGIAPAALVWYRLEGLPMYEGGLKIALLVAVSLYVIAVSARLARFNISDPPGGDRYFYGLPTTLMGALGSSFYLTWEKFALPEGALLAFPLYLVVAAFLMVSAVRLPKLKLRKNKALNAFQIVNVLAAYVLAPLRLWPEILFAQGVGYVVVGVTWCLIYPPEDADAASGPDSPTPVAP
jgi:CDP-diacylglycerol--serine O-phosphatidyltransferase